MKWKVDYLKRRNFISIEYQLYYSNEKLKNVNKRYLYKAWVYYV